MSDPHIQFTQAPAEVSRGVSLVRRRKITCELGEPITWKTASRLEGDEVVYLFRCGGSAGKPFCDGTHNWNGVAKQRGAQTAPTAGYAQRATCMHGGGGGGGGVVVVVRDDRSLCVHAGFGTNKVTNVWKVARGSGAADTVAKASMIAAIEHCPSGASTFRLTQDGPVEPALAVQIAVVDDGPLLVTGKIPITRSDGASDELPGKVAWCRCRQSANVSASPAPAVR